MLVAVVSMRSCRVPWCQGLSFWEIMCGVRIWWNMWCQEGCRVGGRCVETIVSVTVVSESCRVGGCCVEAFVSGAVVSGYVVLECLLLRSTMYYGEGRVDVSNAVGGVVK